MSQCKTDYFEFRQRETGRAHDLLANQGAAAWCAEIGKHHLFSLARVCIASEDKKRQFCELHKVVSNCGLNGIRNSFV